jgi:hypothetical protein
MKIICLLVRLEMKSQGLFDPDRLCAGTYGVEKQTNKGKDISK